MRQKYAHAATQASGAGLAPAAGLERGDRDPRAPVDVVRPVLGPALEGRAAIALEVDDHERRQPALGAVVLPDHRLHPAHRAVDEACLLPHVLEQHHLHADEDPEVVAKTLHVVELGGPGPPGTDRRRTVCVS